MATYIQGVTDYIPNVTFNPDYNFFQGALATKQAQYDKGWEQINSVYNSILNAPLTRESNMERRDQWLSNMESQLRQISNSDLSLPQNVDAATNVFKPFYEDDHMVYDMTWTNHWNKEMQRAELFRTCLDEEKCGDRYWQGGVDLLNIAKQEFANTTDEGSLQYGMTNYVDNFNMMKEATKLAKEAGFEIIQEAPNGQWIVKQKNGDIAVKPLADFISASMSNNQRALNYYKGKAKLLRKADEASYLQMYGDIQMANQRRAEDIRQAQKQNNQARDRVNSAQRRITSDINYIQNENVRSDTPKSILRQELDKLKEDLNVVSQSADRINKDAEQTNKAINQVGIDGLIQNPEMSDALIASALMNGDIMNSAYSIAHINKATTIKANPYEVERTRHKYALSRQREEGSNKLFKDYVTGKMSAQQIAELRMLEGHDPSSDPVISRIALLEEAKQNQVAANIAEESVVNIVENEDAAETRVDTRNGFFKWDEDVTNQKKAQEATDKKYDAMSALVTDNLVANYNNSNGEDPGAQRTVKLLGDQLRRVVAQVKKASGDVPPELAGIGGLSEGELDQLLNDIPSNWSSDTPALLDKNKVTSERITGFLTAADEYLRKTTGTGISLTASGINLEGSAGKQLTEWMKYQNYNSEYSTNKQHDDYEATFVPRIDALHEEDLANQAITQNMLDIHKMFREKESGGANKEFVDALITKNGGFRNKQGYLNNINYKSGWDKYDMQSLNVHAKSNKEQYYQNRDQVRSSLKKLLSEEGINLSDNKIDEMIIYNEEYGTYGYNKIAYNKALTASEKWNEITDDFGDFYNSNQLSGKKIWIDNQEFGPLGGLSGESAGKRSAQMDFSLGSNAGDDKIKEDQASLFLTGVDQLNLVSANDMWNMQSKKDVKPGTASVYVVNRKNDKIENVDPQQVLSSLRGMHEADYSTKDGVKPSAPRQTYKVTRLLDDQIEVEISVDNMGSEKFKTASKVVLRMNEADITSDPTLSKLGFLNAIIGDESKNKRVLLRQDNGQLDIRGPGGSAGGEAYIKSTGGGKANLIVKESYYDTKTGKIKFTEGAYRTPTGEVLNIDINSANLNNIQATVQNDLKNNKVNTETLAQAMEFFVGYVESEKGLEGEKARTEAIRILQGLSEEGVREFMKSDYNTSLLLNLQYYLPEIQEYLKKG